MTAQESTEAPVLATDTAIPSPTIAPTFTAIPTNTDLPTSTSSETATATETASPAPLPSETATVGSPETGLIAEITAELPSESSSIGISSLAWDIPLSDGIVSCHNDEICAYVSVQTGTSHETYIQSVNDSGQTLHATIEFDHYISDITYAITLDQPTTTANVNDGYHRWYAAETLVGQRIWDWPVTPWGPQTYDDLIQSQSANRYEIFLTKSSVGAHFSWTNFTISDYVLGSALATPTPSASDTPVPTATATNTPPPPAPPPVGGACGATNTNAVLLYRLPNDNAETMLLAAGQSFNIVELLDYIHGVSSESWYKIKVSINGEVLTRYLPAETELNLAEAACIETTIVTLTYETVGSGGGGGNGGGGGSGGSGAGWTPDGIIKSQTLPPWPEAYFDSDCLAILDNVALHVQPNPDSPISFVAPNGAYPQIGAKQEVSGVTWYRVSYFQKYIPGQSGAADEWRFYLYSGWFDGTGMNLEALAGCTDIQSYQSPLPSILSSVPRLVFSNPHGGDSEIYLAVGNNYSALTNNSYDDTQPSFAINGEQIAFQSFRDDEYGIYRINADDSGEMALALDNAREPDWYPDGTALVFARGAELYRVNADGTGESQLTNHGTGTAQNPSISHNGAWIVYQALDGLYLIDGTCSALCSSIHLAPLAFEYPAWSPDDQQLAMSFEDDIYTVSLNYSNSSPTLGNPDILTAANSADKYSHPAWAANGESLFFKSYHDGAKSLYKFFGTTNPIIQHGERPDIAILPANCPANIVANIGDYNHVNLRQYPNIYSSIVAEIDANAPIILHEKTSVDGYILKCTPKSRQQNGEIISGCFSFLEVNRSRCLVV